MSLLEGNRSARLLVALAVLVGGAALAQVPEIGTSEEDAASTQGGSAGGAQQPQAGGTGAQQQAGAGGAQESGLTVVSATAQSAPFNSTKELPETGGERTRTALVAEAPVVVSAPKGGAGDVTVTYVPDASGRRQVLTTAPKFDATRAVAFVDELPPGAESGDSPTYRVRADAPQTLPLRLAIAPDIGVRRADGVFLLRYRPDEPENPKPQGSTSAAPKNAASVTVVRVQGAPPQVRLAPATVKLRVTRALGLFSGRALVRDDAGVQLLGAGAEALAAISDEKARLTSARNGQALVTLQTQSEPDLAGVGAEVVVDRVNMTGKYEGSIPLDPGGADATGLPVEVEVQDAFYIPLFVLFGAAFLGGRRVNRWNQKRRREILRAALQAAVEHHRAERTSVRNFFRPPDDLGLDQDPSNWPGSGQPEPSPDADKIPRLNWDIAQARSDEDFAACGKRVEAVVAELDRWHRLAQGFKALGRELRDVELPRTDPALRDSRHLRDRLREDPGPGQRSEDYIAHLADQRRILNRYEQLYHTWQGLEDFQKLDAAESDPAKVYVRVADRKEANAWAELPLELSRALGDAQRAGRLRPPPARREAQESLADVSFARFLTAGELGAIRARVPPTVVVHARDDGAEQRRAERRPSGDRRSAAEILADVKKWDLVVALATTLVATIAFLLPKYTAQHTFGSWEDYLSLAVLGFLGASATGGLALNWGLFPEFRSYSIASASAAAGGPPDDDGGGGEDQDEQEETPEESPDEQEADGEVREQ